MNSMKALAGSVSVTLVVAATVLSGSASAYGDVPTSSTSDASTAQDCTPLQPTGTRLLGPDGITVPDTASDADKQAAATQVYYTMPDGTPFSTIIPPEGFLPQNATPATARAFGFDDAPDDPTALAAWREKYENYKGAVPSEPCIAATSKSSFRSYFTYNWGGFTNDGYSNYNYVYADVKIPTYYTDCGSNGTTDASPWIGFGGHNTQKLIQQGFDSGSTFTATQGARMWYEFLGPGAANPAVFVNPATTNTGDWISQYISYNAGATSFHWYDRTIGYMWTTISYSDISWYYDGTTADYITEFPSGFYAFRHYDKQSWSAVGARHGTTWGDIFNLPYTWVRLSDNMTSTGVMQTENSYGQDAFYQTWLACN